MRDEVDLAFEMNLESLLDQIGVEGVRLLSCWVHPEGFFQDFPLFPGEHCLAIVVCKQAVAQHLVETGCSTLVSIKN